jgi:hypothetical protein
MAASLVPLALALALSSPGGLLHRTGGRVMPPGPGYGWGFPNGNPDGYGWVDYGTYLPLGADRTPDYFFPRYLAVPPIQLFLATYYNPYNQLGQRYLPYSGCGGGVHPMSGLPLGSSLTPVYPYYGAPGDRPVVSPPTFSGRVEGSPTPTSSRNVYP